MRAGKDEGQSTTPVRYSSPVAMNKGISLALEFYKKQHRLPAQHECAPIAERAMSLLNDSDPGSRHYVTGGQIASQFNNVSRDLSSITRRIEKKRKAAAEEGEGEEAAAGTSAEKKKSNVLEEQRLVLLQYLQTAKRGGAIPDDFQSEELGEITAMPPPAPKSTGQKDAGHAANGGGASSSGAHGDSERLRETLQEVRSLRQTVEQMKMALSAIGRNMRGSITDTDLLTVLEAISPDDRG